jgi:predicted aminopeptidase
MGTYQHDQARKQSFLALALETKDRLDQIYESDQSEAAKRDAKAEVLDDLSDQYQRWKLDWRGYAGYDSVMALGPPNGWFTALSTYHHQVPTFNALFVESGEDFETFYQAVERLADMDAETRAAELAQVRQRQELSRRANR